MKKEQAKGYLLEIVIEKLIKVNGYDIISTNFEDESEMRNNGLNVRGRGGYHQVDSLGEFKFTPPLMNPMRLFVEAKYYSKDKKVGIDKVRMGIGILHDVNTNYVTLKMSNEELSLMKFDYHYSIFSTSGFTEEAQRLALAHNISLMDLSCSRFEGILRLISDIVDELFGSKTDISGDDFKRFKNGFRRFINRGGRVRDFVITNLMEELLLNLQGQAIYLASIRSSQIIALFPDNDSTFRESLRKNPNQSVTITWNNIDGDWFIKPKDEPYTLVFRLPILFRNQVIDMMSLKENKFRLISFIAYLDGDNPTLCTLKFDKYATLDLIENSQ